MYIKTNLYLEVIIKYEIIDIIYKAVSEVPLYKLVNGYG